MTSNSSSSLIRIENLPNRFQLAIEPIMRRLSYPLKIENNQIDLNLEIGDQALCAAFLPGEVKIIEIIDINF